MAQPNYEKAGTILFYLTFSLLAGHEMDAMIRHEWRLLPGLAQLADPLARDVFTLLHVPAYVAILWFAAHPDGRIRAITRRIFCLFIAIHGGLHWGLSDHELYEFVPPVETITVYGGAVAALAYLIWERLAARADHQ